jgi:hypothetical protein
LEGQGTGKEKSVASWRKVDTGIIWIKKYGMEELLPKRVRVETMAEIDELK